MNSKECILVVDDDEGIRKSLTLILRKKGYLVESAATGEEALAIAQGRPVNLTLLDMKLPDIIGTQLLAPLLKTHPDMSIIMITGFASVESAVQSLTAGASDYITKPIDLDEILARIKNALDRQHLHSEIRQTEEALQESEEQFRELFNKANDAIYLYEYEPGQQTGHIIEANEVACRMLQYNHDEFLHMSIDQIKAPDEQESVRIQTNPLIRDGHRVFETRHRRRVVR